MPTGMDKAWLFFKDLLIMGLGLLAFTTGTYYSVHDIYNRLSGNDAHALSTVTAFANSSMPFNSSTVSSLLESTTVSAALFTNSTL